MPDLEYEVAHLLRKVLASEEFVQQAEEYFQDHQFNMSVEVAGSFLDALEKKKDQIHYEWYMIGRMGDAIASGREGWWVDMGHPSPDL